MIAVAGIYKNGHIKLEKDYHADKPVRVIVTFLEEIEIQSEKRLMLSDFSFTESRSLLENYKGSFSDSVIEERRESL